MANLINKSKTHCPKGHQLVKGNLVLSALKSGKRSCLTCRRIRDKMRRNPNGNISPAILNARKQFCPAGHELSGDNLDKYSLKIGKRACRICKNEQARTRGQKPEVKKYRADWISQNRVKSRAYSKKWRVNNPEKANLWDKIHPERARQRSRKFEKKPERITYRKEWQKRDYEKNPEKILQKNIRQLEKVAKPLIMSSREYKRAIQAWAKVAKKNQRECAICGSKTNLKSHHLFYKATYPRMSLMKNNVVVLCKKHHDEVHSMNLLQELFKKSIRNLR